MKFKKGLALVLVLLTVVGTLPLGNNCFTTTVKADENILTKGDADSILTNGDAALNVVVPSISTPVIVPSISTPVTYSPAVTVGNENISSVDTATDALIHGLNNSGQAEVAVYTKNEAPALTKSVFEAAIENGKDITINVTNDSNMVMYAWTFDYETLDMNKVTGPLNLSIAFATDKQEDIEKHMGKNDDLFIAIDGYHGDLPGPATVKTYVGDKYANGGEVYLYYYNEETDSIELISNSAIVVKDGYITYTLTHCSVYIVSETTPSELGIEVSNNNVVGSPKTGDETVQWILYIGVLVAGLGIAVVMKKRTRA